MNNLLRSDRLVMLVIIVIACIYFYATENLPTLQVGDPLGPKAFPRLLSAGMLISAALLFMEIRNSKYQAPEFPAEDLLSHEDDVPNEKPSWALLLTVVLWTGAYFVAFEIIGYVLGTAIYLIAMTSYFNKGKWVSNILTSILFSVLSYFAFKLLGAALPQGMLPL